MFYEIFQRYGVVLYFLSSFVKFTSEAVATCPDIPDILNGGMNCGNGFHDMSVCGFHCNNGYTLQPNVQSVVCTADGTVPPYWDTGIPSCTADKCDDIVVENGWVDCNDTSLIYSVCTPSCNAGFMVSSSEPLQCATWRVWVPSEVPTCSKAAAAPITTCGLEPVAPAHGTVSCTDDNNIGSVCTFSCADGFLTTEDSSTCAIRAQDMTGQWSVSSFVCEEAACPDIPDILNGGMYCGDGFTDKSVCGFHCNDGYTLQPNVQSVVCTADGKVPPYWDTSIPSCTEEEIDCGQSPVAPEFGTVSCTNGNKEGSMCTFACNEGYINPPVVTTSTCLKTAPGVGSWDTTPPTCIGSHVAATTLY